MSETGKWADLRGYMPELGLKPLGSLRRHSKFEGCWIGKIGDTALVIYEGKDKDGSPVLILFESPSATLLMRDAQDEASDEGPK